jgi:hypothetical protein
LMRTLWEQCITKRVQPSTSPNPKRKRNPHEPHWLKKFYSYFVLILNYCCFYKLVGDALELLFFGCGSMGHFGWPITLFSKPYGIKVWCYSEKSWGTLWELDGNILVGIHWEQTKKSLSPTKGNKLGSPLECNPKSMSSLLLMGHMKIMVLKLFGFRTMI